MLGLFVWRAGVMDFSNWEHHLRHGMQALRHTHLHCLRDDSIEELHPVLTMLTEPHAFIHAPSELARKLRDTLIRVCRNTVNQAAIQQKM